MGGRSTTSVGRNDPCPCGSGKKFKHCCMDAARSVSATAPVDPPFDAARRLLKAGRYEQAIAPLQRAARLEPDNAAVANDLGMALFFTRRFSDAVAWLRRSLHLRPNAPATQYGLAMALEQAGDLDAAVEAYRRAATLAPDRADAPMRLGDMLLSAGRLEEALAAYERGTAAAPESTPGRLCEAKSLLLGDRTSDAERRLEQLASHDASCAEAHRQLGQLRVEAGRFADAAASFERAIALEPGAAAAHFGLVTSKRMTEADRDVVARILSRLGMTDAPSDRITLHFAAGKALDDLGDRAGAIAHFDVAHRIARELVPFDRADFARLVDRTIARYDRAFLAARPAPGDAGSDESGVLVIGMPRSGTTLVERILSSHPRVAGGGELGYWNATARPWLDAPAERLAAAAPELRAGYLQVLRRAGPGADRVTDKMPLNFLWAGLVHTLFPRMRFVHCRRNPVDTCLSLYTTHLATRWAFTNDRGDLAFYHRQYLRLMDHWRSVLPADRLLDVDYEDVTQAPEASARRLVAFAGLDWDAACLAPERNPDAVRTASKWQVRQPIYRSSVDRWRLYEPWLGELRDLLPAGAATPTPSQDP